LVHRDRGMTTRRLAELDALRGIAALVVVATHVIATATSEEFHIGRDNLLHRFFTEPRLWLELPPVRILLAGHAAVAVFFVLSGFVLTLPMLNNRQPTYLRFLIKRFFRIYVPFAVAIGLAALACAMLRPRAIPELNSWFNLFWREPVTVSLVLSHLTMSGSHILLDAPMWSLIHEVRISVIFPLVALIVIRLPKSAIIFCFMLTCLIIATDPSRLLHGVPGEDTAHIVDSMRDTLSVGIYFVLGISLAANIVAVKSAIASFNALGTMALWAISILLLQVPLRIPLCDLIYFPIGSVLLVTLCLSSPRAQVILNHAFFYWLGRISFSLYLVHFVVLLSMVHLLHNKLPIWLILCGVIPSCLIAAEIMYRVIELPAQKFGKRLSRAQ
jgi:peptidoglycan/LPS O-acetylase OafA/YrhL